MGAGRGIFSSSMIMVFLVIFPWYSHNLISEEDIDLSLNVGLLMTLGVFIAALSLSKNMAETPWHEVFGAFQIGTYAVYVILALYDFSIGTYLENTHVSLSVDFTMFLVLLLVGFGLTIASNLSEIFVEREEEPRLAVIGAPSSRLKREEAGRFLPPPQDLRHAVIEYLTKAKNDFASGKLMLTILTSYTVLEKALSHYGNVDKKNPLEKVAKKADLPSEICKQIRDFRQLREKIEQGDYDPSDREAGDNLELVIQVLTDLSFLTTYQL